jgi:glycosyltransferase involved in cell wall biosynthesis
MDALVIPYPDKPHFRRFGFPMKIYEYMASGIPIVYTKLELVEEVALDCAYGILPDSPKELASALSSIRSRPEEARRVALKALEKSESYSWDSKARRILNLI